jgi:hypothetical protein
MAAQSKGGRPCAQITVACKKAGFAVLGAKKGVGIVSDCIRPIMLGTPQRKEATKPLPQIDPQLVAAHLLGARAHECPLNKIRRPT